MVRRCVCNLCFYALDGFVHDCAFLVRIFMHDLCARICAYAKHMPKFNHFSRTLVAFALLIIGALILRIKQSAYFLAI